MGSTSLDERRELRAAVSQLLATRSDEASVRASMATDSGHDPRLWRELAAMGLQGLAVPEELGGAGAGWAELGVVFEELGRHLACTPFLATVALALPALLAAGDHATTETWLRGIADGSVVATAAVVGDADDDVPLTVSAVDTGSDWRLHGVIEHVLDAGTADLVLVHARTVEGARLFALTPATEGLQALPVRTSDLTRRVFRLVLDQAPATPVGGPRAGQEAARAARLAGTAALAWEQVGGAAAVLDAAVGYAKTRHQFGRPIGSFQAVKHHCADMLVAVETARSAAWELTRALDEERDDLDLVAAIARVVCSEAYVSCASTNVQLHGGIGFTWEHPAHLHVKRSRGSAALLGTPFDVRERLLRLVPVLSQTPTTSAPEGAELKGTAS